jgi:hypothetical protein
LSFPIRRDHAFEGGSKTILSYRSAAALSTKNVRAAPGEESFDIPRAWAYTEKNSAQASGRPAGKIHQLFILSAGRIWYIENSWEVSRWTSREESSCRACS